MTQAEDKTRLLAYTDATTWGGAEECLTTLLRELDGRFAISVVGVDRSTLDRVAARCPGVLVYLVPPFHGKFDFGSLWAHARMFRRLQPDICHINMRIPSSCQAGIVAAMLTGAKIVAVEHLPLYSRSSFVRWSRRQASRLYAAHVAVGEASAKEVEWQLGLPAGSVRTIHNGVVPTDPVRRQATGGPPVVGTLGRLVAQKGHDVLLQALELLPRVRAVVVGEGPDRARLEQLAADLGVADRLELPGWSDDATRYLSNFDVFVFPSWDEGLPLAILEAMLAGVPIVTSDVGSIREAIVNGDSGLLVPAGDPAALAGAIRCLLDDAALRRRIVANARRAALKSFTATAMAMRYTELYDEVLA